MTGNLTVNAIVDADNYTINGGQGSDGQVLTSTGSGVAWETPSSFNADGAQTFNDSGSAVDFRVESDSNANMLFVDGSADRVGIGYGSPAATLDIRTTHTSTDVTAANTNSTLIVGNTGSGNSVYNAIKFAGNQQDMYMMSVNHGTQASRRIGLFVGTVAGDAAADERLSILGDGKVGINLTAPTAYLDVRAPSGVSGPNVAYFKSDQHGLGAYISIGSTYSELRSNNNSYALVLNATSGGPVGVGTTDLTTMKDSSYKGLKVGGAVIQDSGGGNGSATYFGNNSYVGASNNFKHDAGGSCSGIQMTSGDINFYTFDGGGGSADATWSPSARMHIKEQGYVGINSTTPGAYLTIKGGSDNQMQLDSNSSTANTGIFFMENGSNKGELYWRGASDDFRYYNYDRSHEQWVMTAGGKTEFYGKHQGDSIGHFVFSNDGMGDTSSTNCTLMVRNGGIQVQIMPWSSLGARIGTRGGGWSNTSTNACYLTSNDASNIILNTNGSPTLANGTAISSDERLKKNITDIADGQLAKINSLKPRNFEWKDERKAGNQEGFIAQEVESVMPEAVEERASAPDPDDTSRDFEGDIKVLKHEVINARLIKAVQELSAKLEAAEARITTLEG